MGGLARAGISLSSAQNKVAIRGQSITGMAVQGQTVWTPPVSGWKMITSSNISGVGGITPPIDTTGADFLIAAVASYTFAEGATGINDNFSNVWNLLPGNIGPGRVDMFWSRPTSVGPGHTFQALPSTGAWYPALTIIAASGSAADQPDQHVVGDTTSVSITPTAADTAIITGFCANSTPTNVSAPFNIIVISPYTAGVSMGCGIAVLLQKAAAPVTATWTAPSSPFVTAASSFFENPIRVLPG